MGPGMRCGSGRALWVRGCAVGPGVRCGSGRALWVRACAVGWWGRGSCTAALSQCYGAAGGRARGGEGRRV